MSQDNIDVYILKNYYDKTVTQIAKELGVARGTVARRAKKMGLEKEETFVKRELEEIKVIDCDSRLSIYRITNEGRVFNSITNKVLKPKIDNEGYWKIVFQVKGKRIEKRLHRLIALAFIENKDDKPFVNHIDGDKLNYHLDNLEWCTPKENAVHASENNLLRFGENHKSSSITEEQARIIISEIENGLKVSDIVKKYDFATKSIVEKIKNKTRWKHLF